MIGMFVFTKFMHDVKGMYEKKTGELMLPMSEWSDEMQQKFFQYMTTCDAEGFINEILG